MKRDYLKNTIVYIQDKPETNCSEINGIISHYRKCGDTTGEIWVTSQWGEKNLMLLIFDSVFGKDHFPEKGFSLRARTVKDGMLNANIR